MPYAMGASMTIEVHGHRIVGWSVLAQGHGHWGEDTYLTKALQGRIIGNCLDIIGYLRVQPAVADNAKDITVNSITHPSIKDVRRECLCWPGVSVLKRTGCG